MDRDRPGCTGPGRDGTVRRSQASLCARPAYHPRRHGCCRPAARPAPAVSGARLKEKGLVRQDWAGPCRARTRYESVRDAPGRGRAGRSGAVRVTGVLGINITVDCLITDRPSYFLQSI